MPVQQDQMTMKQVMVAEGVPAHKMAIFLCPKCKKQLIEDPNSSNYSDIECDICDKNTTKVLSCRACDYDICYKCAGERA